MSSFCCLKLNKTPIYITFLASVCPIIGAFLNIWTYNIPAFAVGFICIIGFNTIKYKSTYLTRYYLPLLLIILVFQYVTGRGFAILSNGGYVIIFASLFAAFFKVNKGIDGDDLLDGITLLYKFYIVTLLVELIMVMLGFQSDLVMLLRSTETPGYKGYNGADVLQAIGFSYITGLNSILLGSQIAGMLSLFAIIWFIIAFKYMPQYKVEKYGNLWIYLSIFMYLITTNFTGTILAFLAYLIYALGKQKKIKWIKLIFPIILLIGLALLINYSGLFDRISVNDNRVIEHMGNVDDLQYSGADIAVIASMSTREYYFYIHGLPILNWLNQGITNQLFGVTKESVLSGAVFRTGDFALAEILYTSGFRWFIIFVIAVLTLCLPVLKFYNVDDDPDGSLQSWSLFCATNALISVLFFASLIHYPQATANPGALTLFSLHLAVTIYSRYRGTIDGFFKT